MAAARTWGFAALGGTGNNGRTQFLTMVVEPFRFGELRGSGSNRLRWKLELLGTKYGSALVVSILTLRIIRGMARMAVLSSCCSHR